MDSHGRTVPMSEFAGKVTLVVNVASLCGYTGGQGSRGLRGLRCRLGGPALSLAALEGGLDVNTTRPSRTRLKAGPTGQPSAPALRPFKKSLPWKT